MTDPAPPATRVWLLGLMGSGKTTVGSLLARRLGWPYVDNDSVLQEMVGVSAADLAAAQGLDALHDLESAQLAEVARRPPPLVVGVAASVAQRPADLSLVRSTGFVVYLRASSGALAHRVRAGPARALGTEPQAELRAHLRDRDAVYRDAASLVVDTERNAPAAITTTILRSLAASHSAP